VLVWFHGGAWSRGVASAPRTDGAALSRRADVVVVTVSHRLDVFGFLALHDLAPERYPSCNVGMLDLVAALTWVRDNIERFGGDPRAVTVFAESGGADKVNTLLAMPAARGLFHRAMVQSGSSLDRSVPAERAAEAADRLLAELGLGSGGLSALAEVPAQRLVEASGRVTAAMSARFADGVTFYNYVFAPVVDGATSRTIRSVSMPLTGVPRYRSSSAGASSITSIRTGPGWARNSAGSTTRRSDDVSDARLRTTRARSWTCIDVAARRRRRRAFSR
jgi:para-nitrobenzyl esterase